MTTIATGKMRSRSLVGDPADVVDDGRLAADAVVGRACVARAAAAAAARMVGDLARARRSSSGRVRRVLAAETAPVRPSGLMNWLSAR